MNDAAEYTPPDVWTWNKPSGGAFANINRPIAGPTHEKELPVGRHPLQLYSLATPNGVKVTVMLEELLELGHSGAEYDAWLVRINEGDQFGSGFVSANPNSKIPALMDRSGPEPIRVFESGAILLYLAEKFGAFLPTGAAERAECLSWLFWQMGSAPYLGGGFGHFYAYAPTKIEYAIDRFAMEAKRLLDVLDRRLAESRYVAGDDYTIADIANWPWYGLMAKGLAYDAGEFLAVQDYKNVQRWTDLVAERPAVKRGRMVNRRQGRAVEPAARTARRERLRNEDAGQGRGRVTRERADRPALSWPAIGRQSTAAVQPAIHRDVGAGDLGGGVGAEKDRDRGDLFGGDELLGGLGRQHYVLDHLFAGEAAGSHGIGNLMLHQRSPDVTGTDRVDCNPECGGLQRRGLGGGRRCRAWR